MKIIHTTYKGAQYTFDNFNVTENNRSAFEKSMQFAKNIYAKPLHIYGQTTTGKTHLLYAAKNYIEHHYPNTKVIMTNATELAEELVNSISETSSFKAFREKYRSTDVLLVDDIQLLAGKKQTQQEFILLFNELYESGNRIMTTSSYTDGVLDERLLARRFFGEYVTIKTAFSNVLP